MNLPLEADQAHVHLFVVSTHNDNPVVFFDSICTIHDTVSGGSSSTSGQRHQAPDIH